MKSLQGQWHHSRDNGITPGWTDLYGITGGTAGSQAKWKGNLLSSVFKLERTQKLFIRGCFPPKKTPKPCVYISTNWLKTRYTNEFLQDQVSLRVSSAPGEAARGDPASTARRGHEGCAASTSQNPHTLQVRETPALSLP